MKILNNTNAVDYTLSGSGRTLIHVCNNKGVMGSGIALEIKNKIPSAFTKYKDSCKLGEISSSDCYNVINLVAQDSYASNRSNYGKTRYLNYGALSSCLSEINIFELQDLDVTEIVIPYNMGAFRAGGDFEIVKELVDWHLGGIFNITICRLDRG